MTIMYTVAKINGKSADGDRIHTQTEFDAARQIFLTSLFGKFVPFVVEVKWLGIGIYPIRNEFKCFGIRTQISCCCDCLGNNYLDNGIAMVVFLEKNSNKFLQQ